MIYSSFHWIWYLLGFMFEPRITIMVALSVYGASLNIPYFIMALLWLYAGLSAVSIKIKK